MFLFIPNCFFLVWQDTAYEYSKLNKYSQEFVFDTKSIGNAIMDLITTFHNMSSVDNAILCSESDHKKLVENVKTLCQCAINIFSNETKLIKLNSPALVIGDLQGSLESLFEIQERCYSMFPVLTENLVFLGKLNFDPIIIVLTDQLEPGNYTGDFEYGIECLLLVFSLKVLQPNKVFLLRGWNESNIDSKNSFLMQECLSKYGDHYGNKMFNCLSSVFNYMPFAVIINESIVCTHSGFPRNCKLEKLLELPTEIKSLESDAYFAYEVMVITPIEL